LIQLPADPLDGLPIGFVELMELLSGGIGSLPLSVQDEQVDFRLIDVVVYPVYRRDELAHDGTHFSFPDAVRQQLVPHPKQNDLGQCESPILCKGLEAFKLFR